MTRNAATLPYVLLGLAFTHLVGAATIEPVQVLFNPSERPALATDPRSGDAIGWSVGVSGERLALGAQSWKNPAGINTGAAYVFGTVNDAWQVQHMLIAPDGQAGDGFGAAVALVGNRILVGAPDADTPQGQNAGAVYAFVYDGSSWSFEEKFTRASGKAEDRFGARIWAIDDWVFINARNADSPIASYAGVVRAFRSTPSGLSQVQDLYATDGQTGNGFGTALTIQNDILYIGANAVDLPEIPSAGAVYRLSLSAGSWSVIDRFTSPTPTRFRHFGTELASDGNTLAVSAPEVGSMSSGTYGRVYVYDISAATPSLTATLARNEAGMPAWYGLELAVRNDDIFVGNTAPGVFPGRVIRYHYEDGLWTQAQVFSDIDIEADSLGSAIVADGDRIFFGAPKCMASGLLTGCAFEYRRTATNSWQRAQFIRTGDLPNYDQFGHATSLNTDTMLVSAVRDETDLMREVGTVKVMRRQGNGWSYDQTLFCPDPNAGDRCGSRVVLTDTYAFVAAVNDDADNRVNSGSVFAFKRLPDGSFDAPIAIRPDTLNDGANFGASIAADNDRLLIGATGQTVDGVSVAGTVYAYRRVGETWQLQSELTPASPESDLSFGLSLTLDGDRLAVGRKGTASSPIAAQTYRWQDDQWVSDQQVPLPMDNPVAVESINLSGTDLILARVGRVFHYREIAGDWVFQSEIPGPDNDTSFGNATVMRGQQLVISGTGYLHFFHRTSLGWTRYGEATLSTWPERTGLALDSHLAVLGSPKVRGPITGRPESGEVRIFDVMPFNGGFE